MFNVIRMEDSKRIKAFEEMEDATDMASRLSDARDKSFGVQDVSGKVLLVIDPIDPSTRKRSNYGRKRSVILKGDAD